MWNIAFVGCQIFKEPRIEPEAGESGTSCHGVHPFYHPALVRISKTRRYNKRTPGCGLNTKVLFFTHFIVQCELMVKMPSTCTFRAPYSSLFMEDPLHSVTCWGKQRVTFGKYLWAKFRGMYGTSIHIPFAKTQSYGFI